MDDIQPAKAARPASLSCGNKTWTLDQAFSNIPELQPLQSPARLALVLTVSVFVAEGVIMLLLPWLALQSVWFECLVDAGCITVLIMPAVYFWVFRPLDRQMAERQRLIKELQEALANVKTLKGLLPICAGCKQIRDDKGYWKAIETYIMQYSDAQFSHGLCPDCAQKYFPDVASRLSPGNPRTNEAAPLDKRSTCAGRMRH